jgi:hypothetical protein
MPVPEQAQTYVTHARAHSHVLFAAARLVAGVAQARVCFCFAPHITSSPSAHIANTAKLLKHAHLNFSTHARAPAPWEWWPGGRDTADGVRTWHRRASGPPPRPWWKLQPRQQGLERGFHQFELKDTREKRPKSRGARLATKQLACMPPRKTTTPTLRKTKVKASFFHFRKQGFTRKEARVAKSGGTKDSQRHPCES